MMSRCGPASQRSASPFPPETVLESATPFVLSGRALQSGSPTGRRLMMPKLSKLAKLVTLREAAAHFRALNASERRDLERMGATYPGQSAEESICRNVLAHVRGALYKQPSRQVVVLARLEGELRELVNRYDTVGL